MEDIIKIKLITKFEDVVYKIKNIDPTLDQYFEIFKSLLIKVGVSEKSIDDYILELAEGINSLKEPD